MKGKQDVSIIDEIYTKVHLNAERKDKSMTLKELQIGQSAVICTVGGEGALRQHFLDMGVIPGAEVTVVKLAPMGDPIQIHLRGYDITIRKEDGEKIILKEGSVQ